jgi:hypothetical protein
VQVQGGADDDPVVRVTGSIAALGEELGQIKDAVVEVAKRPPPEPPPPPPAPPAPEPLGPHLEQLTQAVLAGAKASRSPDVGPKLDAIAQALDQLGRVLARPPPPQDGIAPSLERMTQVLSAIANRPVAAATPDLSPLLAKLAELKPAPAPSEGPLREEMAHQMLLIQERLQELAASARAALQKDPDGAVKATLVWQHAKEAIELLRALPSRGRKPKSR